MSRFVIISGEDRHTADSLQLAKCLAGEMQLEQRRVVYIERAAGSKNGPKRWRRLAARRWQAVLTPGCDVELIPCDSDAAQAARQRCQLKYLPPLPPPTRQDSKQSQSPKRERARRIDAYAAQWEKIEAAYGPALDAGPRGRYRFELRGQLPRRQRQRHQFGGRPKREVLHLPTGRRFLSLTDAAVAEDINKHSMHRRITTPGSGWVYLDSLLMVDLDRVNTGGNNGEEEKRTGTGIRSRMGEDRERADANARIPVLS